MTTLIRAFVIGLTAVVVATCERVDPGTTVYCIVRDNNAGRDPIWDPVSHLVSHLENRQRIHFFSQTEFAKVPEGYVQLSLVLPKKFINNRIVAGFRSGRACDTEEIIVIVRQTDELDLDDSDTDELPTETIEEVTVGERIGVNEEANGELGYVSARCKPLQTELKEAGTNVLEDLCNDDFVGYCIGCV